MTTFRRFAPVLLALPAMAHAQGFQDLNALETQVTAALGAGIGHDLQGLAAGVHQ